MGSRWIFARAASSSRAFAKSSVVPSLLFGELLSLKWLAIDLEQTRVLQVANISHIVELGLVRSLLSLLIEIHVVAQIKEGKACTALLLMVHLF